MKARKLASARNPRLKQVRKLVERRQREKLGRFVAEGLHLVEAALRARAPIQEVYCTPSFLEGQPALAARLEAGAWPVWLVSQQVMAGVAATEHPQGVLAVVQRLTDASRPPVRPDTLILALEGVGDPGNVGTAIRAAHAAGASLVVLGPGCCDRFNAKAVRASAGGLFGVATMAADDLVGLLAKVRREGAMVVAAEAASPVRCWEVDLRGPTVLVVGSEARGLSAEVLAAADARVGIPMPGGAESLNAATAAGVLLYEAVRQRSG